MSWLSRLDAALKEVAPIHGVSIVSTDKATWRIDFTVDATPAQRAAAASVVAAFDPEAPTSDSVDAERDQRLQSFTFGGVLYDFDEVSRNRIDKARGSALAALIAGAQPGDLRWADANHDFGWIAADNTFHTMDAQTTLAFGNAAAAWEGLHIVAARNLKNMSPIPADYATNAAYWPTA